MIPPWVSLSFLALMVGVVIWLMRRRAAFFAGLQHELAERSQSLKIDETPDSPSSFGYKMSWLAIRTESPKQVVDLLPIDSRQRANWRSGIASAYNGRTFVSPPVDGWVFVVSHRLPQLGSDVDPNAWSRLMQSLAACFDDVQYFGTHRVVEFHAWARFLNGKEQRAYAYLGERGEMLVNRGEQTAGEREPGYEFSDESLSELDESELENVSIPDEDDVMEVAGKWSINPLTLDDRQSPVGVGWVGLKCGKVT